MHEIDFYLDFVSPYAWLAFEHLPLALIGHSYRMRYRPVLAVALFESQGQPVPMQAGPRQDWLRRHASWLARTLEVDLQWPKGHPFDSRDLLRLALACGDDEGLPNRYVTETIFRHVWQGGADAADPDRWQELARLLAPRRDPASEDVERRLRAHADDASAAGVFDVPSMRVDGAIFSGLDALPMLRAWLDGDSGLVSPDAG